MDPMITTARNDAGKIAANPITEYHAAVADSASPVNKVIAANILCFMLCEV